MKRGRFRAGVKVIRYRLNMTRFSVGGYKMSSKKSDYASDRLGMAEDDAVRMKARRYHVREQDNQPNWK